MGFFEIFAAALAGFYAIVPSLGIAIILLTVAVRLLLLPLSIKQTRSMREMQAIQPEVKRLQAKHKGDRQKMNEELMALYKEHGVNPFGGCAPLLLQFPVLIALFYVIQTPLRYLGFTASGRGVVPPDRYEPSNVTGIMETLQNSSLAEDLTSAALRVNQFLGIRLDCDSQAALQGNDPSLLGQTCGDGLLSALPYLALVLLMGLTTWYQQKQMQARQDTSNPQAQQMQLIGRIMPVMLMVFAFTFPSGVVLYWLTTNVWTIVQQRMILNAIPEVTGPKGKTAAGSPKAAANPVADPSSNPGEEAAKPSRPHPSSKKKKRR